MYSRILLIFITISLLGCDPNRVKPEPDVEIVYKWRTYDCGTPPARDKVSFRIPKWVIVDGLYTLTPSHYADLGENMQEIIKASGQLLETVRFYENCIKAANDA